MSKGRGDDSDDLDDVLDGDHKQHQVHLVSRIQVVVLFEVGIALLLDGLPVGQLAVDVAVGLFGGVVVWVNGGNEAGPEERLNRHQARPLPLEVGPDEVLQQFVEEMLVVQTDQPILEYSRALVGPQLDEVILVCERFVGCLCDALEHFGEISQVVDVVRFCRRG